MRQARAWEARDPAVLDVSVFCGFAYADVPDCGMSVIVMADGDDGLVQRVADDLSGQCRLLRHQLYKRALVHGVEDGVTRAAAAAERAAKPVVPLENADRMKDSTYGLREQMRREAGPAMVPYMWVPAAAAARIADGEGSPRGSPLGGPGSRQGRGPREHRD